MKKDAITKTIKLKIVLPKNSDGRQAVYDSHSALNDAAYDYEYLFMLMRQETYFPETLPPALLKLYFDVKKR